jgi:hypothetical protein
MTDVDHQDPDSDAPKGGAREGDPRKQADLQTCGPETGGPGKI